MILLSMSNHSSKDHEYESVSAMSKHLARNPFKKVTTMLQDSKRLSEVSFSIGAVFGIVLIWLALINDVERNVHWIIVSALAIALFWLVAGISYYYWRQDLKRQIPPP
jgi:hypothetical protein